jgi:hypothetical protein
VSLPRVTRPVCAAYDEAINKARLRLPDHHHDPASISNEGGATPRPKYSGDLSFVVGVQGGMGVCDMVLEAPGIGLGVADQLPIDQRRPGGPSPSRECLSDQLCLIPARRMLRIHAPEDGKAEPPQFVRHGPNWRWPPS